MTKLTCDCEQECESTLRQPMLLLSDSNLLDKIRDGSLVELLSRNLANEELVAELFLRSRSRWPDERESLAAVASLESAEGRLSAATDILWILINTREFVTNH